MENRGAHTSDGLWPIAAGLLSAVALVAWLGYTLSLPRTCWYCGKGAGTLIVYGVTGVLIPSIGVYAVVRNYRLLGSGRPHEQLRAAAFGAGLLSALLGLIAFGVGASALLMVLSRR